MESVFENGGMIGAELDYNDVSKYTITSQANVRSRPEYVGGTTQAFSGNAANVSVNISSISLQANDLVIITFVSGSTRLRRFDVNGFTQVNMLYSNDTIDTNLYVGYKFMPATPDTSITLVGGTLDAADAGAVAVQAWRNVDLTTPMDVANVSSTFLNTAIPNPAAITPNTANSVVVVSMGGGHNSANTGRVYSSSDLSNFLSVMSSDTNDAVVGMGSFNWVSGSFNPAAPTWNDTDSGTYSSASVVMALRPRETLGTFYSERNTKNSGIWSLNTVHQAKYNSVDYNNLVFYLDARRFNQLLSNNWFDITLNNDGVLVNAPTPNTSYGGYFTFNGTDEEVTTSISYSNIGSTSFTLFGWFRTTSTAGNKIIGFETNQTGSAYDPFDRYDRPVYVNTSGKLVFGIYTSTFKYLTSTKNVNDNSWHSFYAVHNTVGNSALYVDGQIVSQQAVSSSVNATEYIRIAGYLLSSIYGGTWSGGTNGYFAGDIALVGMYDKALTKKQVIENHNRLINRFGLTTQAKLPEFIGYQFNSSASAASLSVNVPSGVQEGDLLVAIAFDGDGRTHTANASFTSDSTFSIANAGGIVQHKIASASEPASYTFTINSAGKFIAAILCFRNVVYETVGTWGTDTGSTLATAADTTTSSDLNKLLLSVTGGRNSTLQTSTTFSPSGFTDIVKIGLNGTSEAFMVVGMKDWSGGTTGTSQASTTSGVPSDNGSVHVGLF